MVSLKRYVTLKIHVRSRREIPEIDISRYLRSLTRVHAGGKFVRLVKDYFEIQGPYGVHPCSVHTPAGIDMREFIDWFPSEALTVPLLRPLVRIMLIALDFLHTANVVHTGPKN